MLFLYFVIGQSLGKDNSASILPFVFLTLAMTSKLIGWRWERIGGTVAVIAAVALGLYLYGTGPLASFHGVLFYTLPFLIPGILLIICSQEPKPKNAP